MPNAKMYWLHTLSPTHVGAGRGVGYIDLPLHRDKVTNWPLIPGSAFKGVWRDWAEKGDLPNRDVAFGRPSDPEDQKSNAGALVPTDARLVCLPIRSFYGTFAWCTSPMALRMLHRDLTFVGDAGGLNLPGELPEEHVHVANESVVQEAGKVFLEDLDFIAKPCPNANAWADFLAAKLFAGTWQELFKKRFAVLPDTVFNFLTETGTQVDARVKIDDDLKTVVVGALWNEESLPAETILAGFISCDRVYGVGDPVALLNQFTASELTLQVGGKATVGRGRVRCIFGGGQ